MKKVDCTYLLEGADPSRILKKTLVLLVHQVTNQDVNRQLKVIDQYLFLSEKGFLVRDLSNIMQLFEVVRARVLTYPQFEEPLEKLLNICSVPPILTRSLEQLAFDMDMQEYFSWLGYMIIWLKDKKQQMKIINAIYKLLTEESSRRNNVSLEVRRNMAHASNLADLLGDVLDIVDDDIYLELLKIIQVLIEGSKQTCIQILRKGVVSTIIVRLEPTWRDRFPSIKPELPLGTEEIPLSGTIFYVLTSLLGHADAKIMKAPTKFTLWSLQWAFRLFALKDATSVDRNNVLAVLLLLMDIYPDLLLGNLTFSYDIAMLAMSRDIIFHPNWTSDVKLTTSHEDHSCMALLLMCISYLPHCLSGPKVIEECRIVMGLLKLIGHQQAIKWHQLQSCYLIRLSLNILHKIVPASTEEFIEDGGPLLIIQLLNRARENHTLYSYDISFRSIELLALLSYDFKSIRDSVTYNGGVNCIFQICEDLLKPECIMEEYQIFLGVGFCLLEQICSENDARDVLPLIISYMKRYVNPNEREQIQIPKLVIICLSFVWNKIASSTRNSKEFVRNGGVYLMLDIVKMGCLPVKLVGLGALIDLCEKVECIPYLITWKNNGQGIKGLLMEVFRLENQQLSVRTDENGLMIDNLHPLMGESQYYETYCMCEKHFGNASISDMFISCRPKVYCLLQILNHKQNETVEIANEFYKVYSEELSLIDQVTYVLAENFLALKMGEEWKEIAQEFKKMALVPIASDAATLESVVEITDKWGRDLQQMQQEIIKEHRLNQCKEEHALYDTLRDSRLAEAWEALSEMKYIARCSERLFRVTSNFKLQAQILRTLHVKGGNGELHRTFQSDIPVTCMHNQNIQLPSAIQEELVDTPKPTLVSPISSENSTPRCHYQPEGDYLPEQILACTTELDVALPVKAVGCSLTTKPKSSCSK